MVVRAALVLALIGVGGCGFDIPPASHLNGTELIIVRHSVELGPLWPERLGPTFVGMEDAPIAEVLPGDRVQLDAVVVDVDGRRLPATELETLWLQCGFSCVRPWLEFSDPLFDVPCTATEPYTTDEYCLLGTGDGRFELEIPELGDFWRFSGQFAFKPHMSLYGVIAWEGRSAQDCWTARRGGRGDLDGCGFIYHDVAIGPPWVASVHAASIGIEEPDNAAEIPSWALWQPANRTPLAPKLTVSVDGEVVASSVPPLPTIEVDPGARIDVALAFDLLSQLMQRRFWPLKPSSYDAWKLVDERVYSRTETSGWIRRSGDLEPIVGDDTLSFEVDANAVAGRSRVLIIYHDDRGAHDLLTLEFKLR